MKLTGCIRGALVLVLFALSGAEGAEWVYVSKDALGTEWYMDAETVTPLSSDTVRVIEKRVYSDDGRKDMAAKFNPRFSELAYSITNVECNCTTKEFRLTDTGYYDLKGNVIYMVAGKKGEWQAIAPGSVGEALYNRVCPKKDTK